MSKNKASIKKDFSLMCILLIPICIAINIVCGQITGMLKLPVYLDCIGTILSAVLAGPWVGALTGLLSNLINGIMDPSYIPYSLVAVAVGLVAGFMARKKWFTNPWKVIVSGIILSIVSTIIGAPITAYVYGGVTGSGSTLLTGLLMATGQNLLQAVGISVLITNLLDKIISAFIPYIIVKLLPARHLVKYSLGKLYIKNAPVAEELKDAQNM